MTAQIDSAKHRHHETIVVHECDGYRSLHRSDGEANNKHGVGEMGEKWRTPTQLCSRGFGSEGRSHPSFHTHLDPPIGSDFFSKISIDKRCYDQRKTITVPV